MNIKLLNEQAKEAFHAIGYDGRNTDFYSVDTGVDMWHPDLCYTDASGIVRSKIAACPLGTGYSNNHGTFTAGQILSDRFGWAPRARCFAYWVLYNDRRRESPNELIIMAFKDILRRIKANPTRIHICNMSIAGTITANEYDQIVELAREINAAGGTVFVSAGNTGKEEANKIANIDEFISVAAIESDGVPADFSTLLGEMDFAEDGVQVAGICDIKFTDQYDFEAGKKTYWSDGTSMASPELSGKGILIQEMRHGRTGKAYTDAELYKTMIGLATDLSAPDKDKQTGWGFVDINKALQEQNPEPEPIEPPADYVLKKGDTGEKVEPLQNLLLALGYPVGKVDGDYGPITEEAVKQYQRDRGLRDTGVVDQATWDTFLPPKEPPEEEPAPQPTNRIKRFILWLRTLVNKAIYVWGAQGQHGDEIAEEWIRRRETSTKNANRAIALWKKRLAEGVKDIFAFDCSGMIVFWLMLMGIFKSDMSSRGLYARCKKLNRGELREGDLVFRADDDGEIFHVGVYTADHTAIEAKGRDDGVVERDFDVKNEDGTYYWNRFGRLPDLQESDPEPEPEPIPEPTPTPITLQATLILGPCEDNYMRIRKGPDASQPYAARSEISKVLVGEKVLALEEKAGWYRIVLWRDGYYLTGWTNGQAYKLA